MTPRRADAARNDERILAAARAVFAEQGAGAPVSAIARRAGTGIGSLYRRYPTKESLLGELLLATMEGTRADAEAALAEPDPWTALREFVLSSAASGGMPTDPGPLAMTDELLDASRRAREAVAVLLERAQAVGAARPDVNAHDVVMIVTELRRGRVDGRGGGHPEGARVRFDRIVVDGLRARPDADGLGAAPMTWDDVRDTRVGEGRSSSPSAS